MRLGSAVGGINIISKVGGSILHEPAQTASQVVEFGRDGGVGVGWWHSARSRRGERRRDAPEVRGEAIGNLVDFGAGEGRWCWC